MSLWIATPTVVSFLSGMAGGAVVVGIFLGVVYMQHVIDERRRKAALNR